MNSFWSLAYSSPKVPVRLSVLYFSSFPQTSCSAPTVPLGFLSLDASVCYSEGSGLLFCLSEIVTTWVLTSWLLSSNWELTAVHEILLAWSPTGHSNCQPPAESDHALRYRVSLSLDRHCQALISGTRDVSLKGSSANSRSFLHSSSCLVQEIALGTKRHIS